MASSVAAIPMTQSRLRSSNRRIGRPAPPSVDQRPADASHRECGDEHAAERWSAARQRERRSCDLERTEDRANEKGRAEQRRHRGRGRAPTSDPRLMGLAAVLAQQPEHDRGNARDPRRHRQGESGRVDGDQGGNDQRPRQQRNLLGQIHEAVRGGALTGREALAPFDSHRGGNRRERGARHDTEQDERPRTGAGVCRDDEPDQRRRVHRTAQDHDEPRAVGVDESPLERSGGGHSDPHGRGDRTSDRERSGGGSRDEHQADRPGSLGELRKEPEDRLPSDWRRPPQRGVETVSRQRRHGSQAAVAR